MTAASLAGFFLTPKNAILTLKGKACQGEKVEVRNAFSNGERFGGVLAATASAFLRDRRRSPWAFPRGWTNPRRIESKFVVATKAVSSPSVTNALPKVL